MPHAPQSGSSISSNGNSVTLDAFTFDGKPFTVTIPSMTTVACGATAKIFVGHIVHRDQPLRVAVKVFGNMLEDHHQELLRRELRTARQASVGKHPLILPFIGSASFGMQTAIVSHFMRNGNLLEYFRTQKRENIDKAKLIIQVAEAVNHLHTVERLVHGDLKCANVLVSELGDALQADFGLSTFSEKTQASATTAMNVRQTYTVRFAALEILQDIAGQPERVRSKTRESDVYAFGMLVLEAITECPPWAEYHNFAVINNVSKGLLPARPQSGFSQTWWDISGGCWHIEPEKRPTMRIVLKRLRRNPHNTDEIPADLRPSWLTWTPHPRWQPPEVDPGPQTHTAEAPARTLQTEKPAPESPAKAVALGHLADNPAPGPRPTKSATIVPTAHPRRMRSQVIPAVDTPEQHAAATVIQRGFRRRRTGDITTKSESFYFKLCLAATQTHSMRVGYYRALFLGPLPHVLACLTAAETQILGIKADLKLQLTTAQNSVLEILDTQSTAAGKAHKRIKDFRGTLKPESKFHAERNVSALERAINAVDEYIRALPANLSFKFALYDLEKDLKIQHGRNVVITRT